MSSNERFSFAQIGNIAFMEELFRKFRDNPDSVDADWRRFFEGVEFGTSGGLGGAVEAEDARAEAKVEAFINLYRRLGHLSAYLSPIDPKPELANDLLPESHGLKDVDSNRKFHPSNLPSREPMTFGDIHRLLLDTYCGRIGADFREINDIEQVVWLQAQMEGCRNKPEFSAQQKRQIFDLLTMTEGFERFLQDRYLGQKRFSLEGNDALIPLLHFMADHGVSLGAEEFNIGMAHRGRLNVLANFMNKSPEMLLKDFEGAEFNPFDIDGDVKYHKGFASEVKTLAERKLRLLLLPNPSHLEIVNPVVEGFARARQYQVNDKQRQKIVPLLIHGDAAFIAQGSVAETLNLAQLDAYTTGGTVHVIINNQIGFTADPSEGRSCPYASEIAKVIRAPVLHVNADDVEACVWTAQLAMAYRQKFGRDVVIDLIGYRRHGHNETDEPGFTQPLMYKVIKQHPTVLAQYTEQLTQDGVLTKDDAESAMKNWRARLQKAMETVRSGVAVADFVTPKAFEAIFKHDKVTQEIFDKPADTGVSAAKLRALGNKACTLPSSVHPHPKIAKLLDSRLAMLEGDGAVDWGMAEILCYASLATEGHHIRLSGQDCRRGTFSHRHAVLVDYETGKPYQPLNNLDKKQAYVDVINSPLSELAVMGFDFGYSVAEPNALVMWEAQFGDFVNGAQIVVDQFLVASEAKWKQVSGLTLLLPHGYEGQGPEHSSARPERFLQLCGNLNIQVAIPTTPAQMFHLLRRQLKRSFRKPLIIMTPKSLLRHPKVISTLKDFGDVGFQEVIDDATIAKPKLAETVVLCTGKLYYELIEARLSAENDTLPIVRLEQLYPFPEEKLKAVLARYANAKNLVWTQEEPVNMGAWSFVRPRLEELVGKQMKIRYSGRKGAGTTAEGSLKQHVKEQTRIIQDALGLTSSISKNSDAVAK